MRLSSKFACLFLLSTALEAAPVVDWNAAQVTGGNSSRLVVSTALNPEVPTLTSENWAGYTGAPVYGAITKDVQGLWGGAKSSASGLRVRFNNGLIADEKVSGLFIFKMSRPVEFTEDEDTLDAAEIHCSQIQRLSNLEVQFVVEDAGQYYISSSSGNLAGGIVSGSLLTSYSVEATDPRTVWYEYDPVTDASGVAGGGDVVVSPTFRDIDFIGFRIVAEGASNETLGVNAGVRVFSARAVNNPLGKDKTRFLGCAFSPSSLDGFAAYWNQSTPENDGKWGVVERQRGVMDWSALDEAYDAAKENGHLFHMHVLVWGQQQPDWIESLSTAEQRTEIEEWFAAVATRYPKIDYLEVVNEPLHAPPSGIGSGNYIEALGGAGSTGWEWVVESFRLARQYFPGAQLMINDFNIIGNSRKTEEYISIIELLQAELLIDIIGVQTHSFTTMGKSAALMKANLDLLAATGLPIQITEMDVDGADNLGGDPIVYQQNDALQLSQYQRIFPVFWEHPAVMGVTLWGFRPGLWRNDQMAYLINADGSARPAMEWLYEYVAGPEMPLNSAALASLQVRRTLRLEKSTGRGRVAMTTQDDALKITGLTLVPNGDFSAGSSNWQTGNQSGGTWSFPSSGGVGGGGYANFAFTSGGTAWGGVLVNPVTAAPGPFLSLESLGLFVGDVPILQFDGMTDVADTPMGLKIESYDAAGHLISQPLDNVGGDYNFSTDGSVGTWSTYQTTGTYAIPPNTVSVKIVPLYLPQEYVVAGTVNVSFDNIGMVVGGNAEVDSWEFGYGSESTLTATPDAGYVFAGWTGDASGTSNPLSVVMDGDKAIGASFAAIEQTLAIDSSIANGSIAGAGVYNQGATATLTASPSFGYAFVGWTGDASGADNPLSLVMDGDKAIGAIFTPTASGAIDYSVQGLNGVAIADSEGVAITSGSAMAFGYFPLTLTAPLTQTSSWDEVLGVGTENEFVTLFSGIMGYETGGVTYDGVFAGGEQQYVDSSGKQMVMVISNASVLTQGTEVGIFSSLNESWTIPALAAPVPALLAVDVNSADLILYGNQGIGDSAFPDQSYGFLDNLNTDIFRDPDSDGDGLIDAVETNTGVYLSATDTGTDPENPDSDGDGLADGVETNSGTYLGTENTGTNPLAADTSGDGFSDGDGVAFGFDPNLDYTPVVDFVYSESEEGSERFDLYTESTIHELNQGGVVLPQVGKTVTMRLQVKTKGDLTQPEWVKDGIETFLIELPPPKAFLRVRALGPSPGN